jgi:HlyD family secretion protein
MRAKRIVPSLVAVAIVGLFGSTLWFLYQKSRPKPVGIETDKPFVADIIKKSVAAGAIQPRKEIEIKPKISGILKRLYVEAGNRVKAGDLIADVQVIPDVINLNEAELRLNSAKLAVDRAKRELDRAETLGTKGAAALGELDKLRSDYAQATEEARAAEMRVHLVREGAVGRSKSASTRVESTVAGTVLAILIREGSSVINANSFNPGTTIASVADMTDMIFKGRVDESEVGKLKENMPVEIVVGALEDLKFTGKLERISPKSLAKEGTTEFEIEAAFRPPEGVLVRAGYSANANIVLARRDKVLAVNEGLLIFEGDKRFVEVQVGPAKFEKREVKLGLSDGIKAEVLSGVTAGDVLRKPRRTTPTPERS